MTELEFENLCRSALDIFKGLSPYDSGNMANNATRLEKRGTFSHAIVIDETIAPYSVYTDIPWGETSPVIINSKNPARIGQESVLWKDGHPKKNPNEGWISAAVELVAEEMARRLCGKMKVEE